MTPSNFEEKTTKRTEIFKGNIIDVYVDDVTLPDGRHATRELVLHHGAVAVLAVTNEQKIVLVRQFRKPLERDTLEIPAGKIDPGEENDPIHTAKRELEEETDYQANEWKEIVGMYSTPGFSDEFLTIYEAKHLTKAARPLAQGEDEFLQCEELTLSEVKDAIASGLICDAKTLYAVTYWELQLTKGGTEVS